MKRRREWLLRAFVAAALPAVFAAATRSQTAAKVGVLLYTAAPAPGQPDGLLDAFRAGLRNLGWVEGRNLVLEVRYAGGSNPRAAELAAELVRLNVAVIVTAGAPTTYAARAATATIPIVMAVIGDPVASGFVASLARPGGNITGFSTLDEDLDGKRIELLKQASPGMARIAMLWSPNDAGMSLAFGRAEVASQTLKLALQSLAVRDAGGLPGVVEAAGNARVQALMVTAQPFTLRHQAEILAAVDQLRLPAIYNDRRFVDAGGLMSYGPNLADLYRRAASHVHRILEGAKPADLPVEQPTKIEFIVNLRAARGLGIALPAALLARADEVIE